MTKDERLEFIRRRCAKDSGQYLEPTDDDIFDELARFGTTIEPENDPIYEACINAIFE